MESVCSWGHRALRLFKLASFPPPGRRGAHSRVEVFEPLLYRGELPVVEARDVSDEILRTKHLVLFGDERSNPLIARALPGLPLRWTPEGVVLGPGSAGERRFPGAGQVPVLIHPNPLSPPDADQRYLVLNSGFTFREEHDVNNALQNRRLPDWAVIDLAVPPDGRDPGGIVAADFFDEAWSVKPAR